MKQDFAHDYVGQHQIESWESCVSVACPSQHANAHHSYLYLVLSQLCTQVHLLMTLWFTLLSDCEVASLTSSGSQVSQMRGNGLPYMLFLCLQLLIRWMKLAVVIKQFMLILLLTAVLPQHTLWDATSIYTSSHVTNLMGFCGCFLILIINASVFEPWHIYILRCLLTHGPLNNTDNSWHNNNVGTICIWVQCGNGKRPGGLYTTATLKDYIP